jgi:glycosyltransferase involved in cell wall biosynthesis
VRIGIYAPYLSTLGGGEKYALVILSEAVNAGNDVRLLSPEKPAPERWLRLNVEVDPACFSWVRTVDDEAATAASHDLDVFITIHNDVPPSSRARRSIAVLQFPFRPLGWATLDDLLHPFDSYRRRQEAPRRFDSYDEFICYSKFVRRHLAARWGVDARVVHPPVDIPDEPLDGPRCPTIVAVGRFFRSGNNKRHDVLIKAFARLWHESGRPDDWRLHLVGGAHEVEGPAHLRNLRRLASDIPVTFHVDAPLRTLEQLYTESSMFWHAAGFGESDRRHPERMEHFGITTVEAMARGCVVLAVPKGGQPEIVEDGVNGFHWTTTDELVERSRNVLVDASAFDRIRERAIKSARAYSTERFRSDVRRLLHDEEPARR